MFCQNCGTQIPDGAKFCEGCGQPIQPTKQVNQPVPQGGQSIPPMQQGVQTAQQNGQPMQQVAQATQQNVQPMQQGGSMIQQGGQPMRQMPYQGQPGQPYMQPAQMNYQQPGQMKKKGNGAVIGIIAAVIAVLIIGGAAAGYYVIKLLPVKKINAAVEAKDFNEVNELYDKVSDKEVKADVSAAMVKYADEIRDQYISEDISYDDAMKEYDVLKTKVLTDDKQLKSDTEEIGKYAESRGFYNKAAEQLNSKYYPDAIENFSKVIEEDSAYYKKAKKGIEECDKGITDMLIGKWSFDYDLAQVFEEELGELGEELDISGLKMNITFVLEFGEDGYLNMEIDRKSFDAYMNSIIDMVVKNIEDKVLAQGVTKEEYGQYMMEEFGTDDFGKLLRQELDGDDLYNETKKTLGDFSEKTYEVKTVSCKWEIMMI